MKGQDNFSIDSIGNYLNGVWATTMDKNENALFMIKDDSILYLESPSKSYPLSIKNKMITIQLDSFTTNEEIKTMVYDSFTVLIDGRLVTYYRRF